MLISCNRDKSENPWGIFHQISSVKDYSCFYTSGVLGSAINLICLYIDICWLQEVDILPEVNHELLSFKGYQLLIEQNEMKSRTGIYIKNKVKFNKRTELEPLNGGIIVLDIDLV